MLKVLIDSGNALAATGIGTYSRSLLESLQKYATNEINAEDAGVSVPATSLRPLRRLAYFGKLGLLRQRGYMRAHLIHFTSPYVPPRYPGVGYVVTIHDLDSIVLSSAYSRHFSLRYKIIHDKIVERSDRIVTVSNAVRREILEHWQLDESRVQTAGEGVSAEFADLAQATEKTMPPEPVILFVGTISAKKNSAWLVRTVAKGVRLGAIPKLKLLLAGSRGYGFHGVESELRMAQDIVRWKPGLSTKEIVKLYCSCSAVVLPSLREGFGLPLLEAMCCDKPIIASRIPTSVEVANGVANFFSLDDEEEFYESVRAALADRNAERRRLLSTQQLDKYSWENCARLYVDIYKDFEHRAANR
jgi:glycosyltransferase involved in cell wall biosynthesis